MVIASIFFKVPTPGAVKTRLAQGVGPHVAAQLATAFFLDTLSLVSSVPGLQPVVSTNGELPPSLLEEIPCPIWDQGSGGLGARLERIFQRGLQSAPRVIALGADSPGLRPEALIELSGLGGRYDAVLGPAEDGGFYALSLNQCPSGLLQDIPWSCADTCSATEARINEHGLSSTRAASFFDVDHPADLARLAGALQGGELLAPRTATLLTALQLEGNKVLG